MLVMLFWCWLFTSTAGARSTLFLLVFSFCFDGVVGIGGVVLCLGFGDVGRTCLFGDAGVHIDCLS